MRPLLYRVITLVVFAVPALAQDTTLSTNSQIPINVGVFVPCAAGGAGETVAVAGTLHVLNVVTIDATSIHVQEHFNPAGVVGTGLTTGDKYRGTGITRSSFHVTPAGTFEFTHINRFNVIGQGRAANFTIRETVHTTVLADGTATSTVGNFTTVCE